MSDQKQWHIEGDDKKPYSQHHTKCSSDNVHGDESRCRGKFCEGRLEGLWNEESLLLRVLDPQSR